MKNMFTKTRSVLLPRLVRPRPGVQVLSTTRTKSHQHAALLGSLTAVSLAAAAVVVQRDTDTAPFAAAKEPPLLHPFAAATAVCDEDRLERWNDRWAAGRVAWHREKPNDILVKNYEVFLGSKGAAARVLVPLCGKTVDMPFMAQRGHEVVGVDGVEAAAWQLQRDSWLNFETAQLEPSGAGDGKRPGFIAAPTFQKQRSGYVFKTDALGTGYYLDTKGIKVFRDAKKRISVVVADFLHLTPKDLGTFDRVWDRGALVALRPEDREDYVATCDSMLEPGGKILLVTMKYEQSAKKGPPFSIPVDEVQRLYGGKLGYTVEMLSSDDAKQIYQGGSWDDLHKKSGLEECTFLLTKPGPFRPGWFARTILQRKG